MWFNTPASLLEMFALVKVKQAAAAVGRQRFSVRSVNRLRAFSTGHSSSEHGEEGNDVYDIIISGGGMVGTAMACSLGEFPQNSQFTLVLFLCNVSYDWFKYSVSQKAQL